jgi:hypothetical protein
MLIVAVPCLSALSVDETSDHWRVDRMLGRLHWPAAMGATVLTMICVACPASAVVLSLLPNPFSQDVPESRATGTVDFTLTNISGPAVTVNLIDASFHGPVGGTDGLDALSGISVPAATDGCIVAGVGVLLAAGGSCKFTALFTIADLDPTDATDHPDFGQWKILGTAGLVGFVPFDSGRSAIVNVVDDGFVGSTPEPSALALLGISVLPLWLSRLRKKRQV